MKEQTILEDLRAFRRERFPDRFNVVWLRGRHEMTEAEAKRILARFKTEEEA